MKTSFRPKSNAIIVRISALLYSLIFSSWTKMDKLKNPMRSILWENTMELLILAIWVLELADLASELLKWEF